MSDDEIRMKMITDHSAYSDEEVAHGIEKSPTVNAIKNARPYDKFIYAFLFAGWLLNSDVIISQAIIGLSVYQRNLLGL